MMYEEIVIDHPREEYGPVSHVVKAAVTLFSLGY
jgi:hypothetical protein